MAQTAAQRAVFSHFSVESTAMIAISTSSMRARSMAIWSWKDESKRRSTAASKKRTAGSRAMPSVARHRRGLLKSATVMHMKTEASVKSAGFTGEMPAL